MGTSTMIVVNFVVMAIVLFFTEFTVCRGASGRLVARRAHNPMSIVASLYLLSAFCALLVDPNMLPEFHSRQYHWSFFLIYTLGLTITLIPCILLKRFHVPKIHIVKSPSLMLCLYGASIAAWYSFIYQLPYAYASIREGAAVTRHLLNVQNVTFLPDSPFTTVAVGISSFYAIFMFAWFICQTQPVGKLISLSMFVGSLSYVVSLATFAGRTGFVLYLAVFVFMYRLFSSQLSRHSYLVVRRIGVGVSLIGVAGLVAITLQRFAISHDLQYLFYGTIGYLGQQPYVFAESLYEHANFYGIGHNLPVVAALIGHPYGAVVKTVPYQWMFGTFIENFYMIDGLWSLTLGIVATTCLFCYYTFRYGRSRNSTFLIIYFLYFEFMVGGVFYFILGSWSGNIHILAMFIIFYIARVALKNRPRAVLTDHSTW